MAYEINPMILEKLDSRKEIDEKLKKFIKDILIFEKKKMNLEEYQYTKEYKSMVDQYIQSENETK